MGNNSVNAVVKVDSLLIKEVERIMQKNEYRLKFVNKKQFVDLAIQNYLDELKKEEKNEKKK